jgi:hypothetical protein
MRRVYDFVDLPTLQNAVAMLETDSGEPAPTVPQIGTRRGPKKRKKRRRNRLQRTDSRGEAKR